MSQSYTIPKEAKAAVLTQEGGTYQIQSVPVKQASDLKVGEVLVKIAYSGVCHTDLHCGQGDWPVKATFPLIGGHEGAGTVVAVARGTETNLKQGDRVGVKWVASSCNRCQFCRQGYEPLCPEAQCSGCTVDGTFAQYTVSYASQLTPIPDKLDLADAAPILCAGVTVYKSLLESNARAGEWVVIAGAGGGLGHLAVQYAVYMGLRVIAIDSGEEKRELCKKLGAEVWIDFKEEKDIVKAVKAATPDGFGPHASICTASSGKGYEQALEQIRPHGTVVAVGLPADAKIQAEVFWTVFQSKRLVGSYVGNRQDAIEALEIAALGKVKTSYRVEPLSALPKVFEQMAAGKLSGRVVLDIAK